MLDVGKMVDAVLDVIDKPLARMHERIKAVEARAPEKGEPGEPGLVGPPGEKGDSGEPGKDGAAAEIPELPPELAERIQSVMEALAQPMPEPIEAAPVAIATEISRRVTGAVITRSGELALAYSDGSGERLGNVIGLQGEKGLPGERGADGVGIKGDEGPPGRDGVGVTAAQINRDGELMLTLSDGSVLTPGRVTAAKK